MLYYWKGRCFTSQYQQTLAIQRALHRSNQFNGYKGRLSYRDGDECRSSISREEQLRRVRTDFFESKDNENF